MKKYLSSVIAVLMIFSLTACFPTGQDNNTVKKDGDTVKNSATSNSSGLVPTETIPSTLSETLLDNLQIEANITVPENAQWKTYTAKAKSFSEAELNAAFLNEKTVTSRNESKIYEDSDEITVTYYFSDDTSINVQDGSFGYIHPQYGDRFFKFIYARQDTGGFIRPDIGEIYTKSSLDSLNKEDAIALVKGKLTALGIEFLDAPTVYALDYETLQDQWQKSGLEGETLKDGSTAKAWTKDDEAYLIVFREQAGNLPISKASYVDPEKSEYVYGGWVYGLVSKDGLIFLECNCIYESSNPSDSFSIVSFGAAKDVVKRKYQNIILTDPVVITDISAELLPVFKSRNKFELVPVWTFTVTQRQTIEGNLVVSTFPVFVNAKTGEEVRIGGAL